MTYLSGNSRTLWSTGRHLMKRNKDSGVWEGKIIILQKNLVHNCMQCLLSFQGTLIFGSEATVPASMFFDVNPENGEIRIIDSTGLLADSATHYYIPVTVYDEARTEKTATATFTASMSRNENKPTFLDSNYRFQITDRYGLGQEVGRVNATDADEKVSRSCHGSGKQVTLNNT